MHRKRIFRLFLAILPFLLLQACGGEDFVTAPDGSAGPLVIYPDYKDVTIPVNIAPLNFRYTFGTVLAWWRKRGSITSTASR